MHLDPSLAPALYPPAPDAVPPDIARPSRAYRLRALLALAGFIGLVAGYLALTAWFLWLAYHLLFQVAPHQASGTWAIVAGLGAALLGFFTLRAPFSSRHATQPSGLSITAAEQPQLFAFLRRLADELGAPLPRGVYLSAGVNAAVRSRPSLRDLLLPSRKDLEIGLGLVNVLTLAELKAVIAHEFGHFTQGSAVLGRYVYVSTQIAYRIANRRDALDALLSGLTRRIMFNLWWLFVMAGAWILRLTLWAIRTLMGEASRILLRSQRALSLQMELQADLVAVSATGSDPIVRSLWKLQNADQAWKYACGFGQAELSRGRRIPDLFELQRAGITHVETLFGNSSATGAQPSSEPEQDSLRLFEARYSPPPQMWATHPANFEREENCKRRYVPSHYDDTSAWALFANAAALRTHVTGEVIAGNATPNRTAVAVSGEEALQRFEQAFTRPSLEPRFRGIYLGRPVARMAAEVADLYETCPAAGDAASTLDSLYPAPLGQTAARYRALVEEHAGLKALETGDIEPVDGVIRHRGRVIQRRELPAIRYEVQSEMDRLAAELAEHDKRCRRAHRTAAASIGNGWEEYLVGIAALLHYAEHSEANVCDARGYFAYVLATVSRHGKATENDALSLLTAAEILHTALVEGFAQAPALALDPLTAQRAGWESWPLGKIGFQLPVPTRGNLQPWINDVSRWFALVAGSFGQLRSAALDQLLATEDSIASAYRECKSIGSPPQSPAVPRDFTRRPPGAERLRDLDDGDWLEKWQSAPGPLNAASRLVAAAALICLVSISGISLGTYDNPSAQFRKAVDIARTATTYAAYSSAAEWYAKAAARGFAPAENNLAVLYSQGKGVPHDLARAVSLFQEAAARGSLEAMVNLGGAESNLGAAYLTGHGVPRNYPLALYWFGMAANRRIPGAENALGYMYANGLGTKADLETSVSWYRAAALQGNTMAENSLGIAYLQGAGVPRDSRQAEAWFRTAAEHGLATAQFNLAIRYLKGDGVPKDRDMGISWLRKAAAQGLVQAKSALSLLDAGTSEQHPQGPRLDLSMPTARFHQPNE